MPDMSHSHVPQAARGPHTATVERTAHWERGALSGRRADADGLVPGVKISDLQVVPVPAQYRPARAAAAIVRCGRGRAAT